jgi:seryl-tRNA synthetase
MQRLEEIEQVLDQVIEGARELVLQQDVHEIEVMEEQLDAIRGKINEYIEQVGELTSRVEEEQEGREDPVSEKIARLNLLNREITEMEKYLTSFGDLDCDLKRAEIQLKEKEQELCRLEDEFYNI